jgi:glycerophosphoryl diester phosphodiesterase
MHYWKTTQGPLLYAHRGANREFPENSIEAFRRAVDQGADVLELDVHPTRDGVFVVSHDDTGLRNAGVAAAIATCDWSEVCTWDIGWGFEDARTSEFPFRGHGIRLARIESVLEAFPETALNVDIKQATLDQTSRLLAAIRQAGAEHRVLLTSFGRRQLAALKRLKYMGPIGFSQLDVARLLLSPEWLSKMVGFLGARVQVPVRSGPFDFTRQRFIDKCHRLGLAVDYWVINEPGLVRELLNGGADGIVTDDPALIAGVFRTSPQTAAWRERHPGGNR